MIYVRSRRPIATVAVCGAGCALVFAALTFAVLQVPGGLVAAVALAAGAVAALAVTVWLRWTEPFSGTNPVVFAKTALTTTVITTLVWLVVTYVTKAEPEPVLVKFYRSVRPQITGWQPVARLAPEVPPTRDLGRNLLSWILGCFMVYMALFGLGHVLLGPFWEGIALLTASAICAGALYSNIARSDWSEETPVAGDAGAVARH